jgi:hypothetical protein
MNTEQILTWIASNYSNIERLYNMECPNMGLLEYGYMVYIDHMRLGAIN